MRRGIVSLAVLAVIGLGAGPVFGSCMTVGGETICGRVDGFAGDCDGPGTTCNAGSGFVEVFGFALASTGVERVEILIESVQFPGQAITLGRAVYGWDRPDAAALYPGFPNQPRFGWTYNINSPLFANGLYDVWARVVTVGGNTKELGAEQVLFTNNGAVLKPFGEIDRPGQNEDIFGTCYDRGFCGDGICEIGLGEDCRDCPLDCNGQELGAFDDFCCGYGAGPSSLDCDDSRCEEGGFSCSEERQIRYTVVSGWALDLGVTPNEDEGIAWVELETNGSILDNTQTGCVFDRHLGGLSNCYGLPRIDLERRFPFAFNAPSAGYRFVMDVGAMLNDNTVILGSNDIIVRAGDISDQFEDIDRITVNFLCEEDFSEPSFGETEAPREGRLYTGTFNFQGWALDGERVETIDLYVDGDDVDADVHFILREGSAVMVDDDGNETPVPGGYRYDADDPDFDLPAGFGTRPVVAADYPGFPNTNEPVWQLTGFDSTLLTNGFHTLQVRVTDGQGDSNFIGGEVTFRVDNTSFALLGLYKTTVLEP